MLQFCRGVSGVALVAVWAITRSKAPRYHGHGREVTSRGRKKLLAKSGGSFCLGLAMRPHEAPAIIQPMLSNMPRQLTVKGGIAVA